MAYDLEGAIARITSCMIQDKEPRVSESDSPPHNRVEMLKVELVLNPDEFFISFRGDGLEGPLGKAPTMKLSLIQFADQLDNDPLYKERT